MIKGVLPLLSRQCILISLAFSACIANSSAAAVTDALVAYWPLEEISADSTTPDLVFTNTMTVIGAPAVTPGQAGNAFTFDGSTTYLLNAHDSDNGPTGLPIYRGGQYTITMWVKGAAQTAKYLYCEASTNSTAPLVILQTGNAAANNAKLDVIIRPDSGAALLNHVVSSQVVFDDTWHHIAWTDDHGSVRLYIDGVLDSSNFNYTPAGAFTLNTSAIGTLVRATVSTGNIFNGQIDEVAVWERVLTADEVTQVKTTGLPNPVPPTPLVLTSVPSDVTRAYGDWALFSVTHQGTRPFTYQWFKNGVEIQDATNRTYQTPALTTANSGDKYSVKVTNPAGSQTTPEVTVTVNADPTPDLRAGLVNYWPLDTIDATDTLLTTEDLYSGNQMVLVGFTSQSDVVPGKFGNALDFDGARYTYRSNGVPIYTATNYSVSMWVKGDFTGQNDRRVFSEGATNNNNPLFTLGTDNQGTTSSATVFVRSDTGVSAALTGKKSTRPVFEADIWHHIVWTDANGQGKLYVDGALDETDYTYTRTNLTLNVTSLGAVLRATAGNFFIGSIDEVATWKRVLSWTEIQSLMTNGVPQPIAIIAPSIVTQPANHTNNVFQGDTVQFSVQATGTVPLTYEWYRNGAKIDPSGNASAATDTLILTNVALADGDSSFYVKVSNPAGTAQSDSAQLNVQPYTPATSGEVLKIDVDLSGSPNIQPGFNEFTLAMNGTNYNGVGVTISGLGGAAMAERNRTVAPMVTNNPPALTQAQIYNDFIFANSTTDGTGLRILIERLAPNTKYALTIWSFDPTSTGARFADWSETSGDVPIEIQTGYTFDGSILPVNDNEQTINAVVTSSPTGKLQIDGIKDGGTSFGVFVNAIRLVANPGMGISKVEISGNSLLITVDIPSADQAVSIEQRADFSTGAWTPANATINAQSATSITFEIPFDAATEKMFFHAVAP